MKDRFWQVVYSLVPTIRAFFATVVDRVLLAMKKPAAKVVIAVVAALLIIAFLTQGAMAEVDYDVVAVEVQPDGSAIAYLTAKQVAQCEAQGGCTFVTSQGMGEFGEEYCKARGERI